MPEALLERLDLELLVELAASGSLIKAAKALGVHHATAFRRLAELENRAGIPMFERLPHGYLPTAPTQKLLASARRLRADLLELDARVRQLDKAAAAPLSVTTSDGLGATFVPRLVHAFNDAYPGIVVDLVVDNRVLSVPEREIDIALRPAREVSGDMVCRRVAAIGYSLYGSRDYVRRHGSLDANHLDLNGHAVCGYAPSVAYFTTAKWLERHAAGARLIVQCNSLTSMQGFARSGMCIAALPCVVGDADRDLVRLAPPIAAMETSLWVCTHKRLRKAPRVRAFLDFFYEAIANERLGLAGLRQD